MLLVHSKKAFAVSEHLKPFAEISKNSREYQGHGWGCAYLLDGDWRIYKSILPIWEDDLSRFGGTTLLMAHARSAFRNEGITVENNMPFRQGDLVYIFNGELRGVRIREQGRIGAEKIFRTILRYHRGDFFKAMKQAIDVLSKRCAYVRAMNMIVSDKQNIYLSCLFNENPDYFTLRMKRHGAALVVCSEPYLGQNDWKDIPNRSVEVMEL